MNLHFLASLTWIPPSFHHLIMRTGLLILSQQLFWGLKDCQTQLFNFPWGPQEVNSHRHFEVCRASNILILLVTIQGIFCSQVERGWVYSMDNFWLNKSHHSSRKLKSKLQPNACSPKSICLGWDSQSFWGFTMPLEDRVVKPCCQAFNKHVLAWHSDYKKKKKQQSALICLSVFWTIFCLFSVSSVLSQIDWYEISFDSLLVQVCLNKRNEQPAHFSVCYTPTLIPYIRSLKYIFIDML